MPWLVFNSLNQSYKYGGFVQRNPHKFWHGMDPSSILLMKSCVWLSFVLITQDIYIVLVLCTYFDFVFDLVIWVVIIWVVIRALVLTCFVNSLLHLLHNQHSFVFFLLFDVLIITLHTTHHFIPTYCSNIHNSLDNLFVRLFW